MSIIDGSTEYEIRTMPSKNKLGFRQPNTNYNVNDIAYHNSLPVGWYLQCITAGTSNNNNLIINNPSIGNTINDGTLTWKITRNLGLDGGTINGDLNILGTIRSTEATPNVLFFDNKTIPQIKELLINYITNLQVIFDGTSYMRRVQSSFNLNTFVNLWNKNDEISIINAAQIISITFLIHTPEYFKIRLESYSDLIYEIVYAEQWGKARRIINSDSDDNNKELVNIDGDLTITGKIHGKNGNHRLSLCAGNLTDNNRGGLIELFDKNFNDPTSLAGAVDIYAITDTQSSYIRLKANGELIYAPNESQRDLGSAAINAKSFGTNGYIKYTSGLIVQWGTLSYSNTNNITINFNVSFETSLYICIANALINNYVNDNITIHPIVTLLRGETRTAQPINVSEPGRAIKWLAIGY